MANGNGTFHLGTKILDRYGPTTVMLIVVCVAVFKVASWVGPKVDQFLIAHIRQMEQLTETQIRQTQILQDSLKMLKESNVIETRIEEAVKEDLELSKKNQELILDILNKHEEP